MTIKKIDRDKCETCLLRASSECPIVESCSVDVIRLDEGGYPYIAYADDCQSCFFCQVDCPHGAVEVSAELPLPFLLSY